MKTMQVSVRRKDGGIVADIRRVVSITVDDGHSFILTVLTPNGPKEQLPMQGLDILHVEVEHY